MQIPAHQIDNVLKAYKRLILNKRSQDQRSLPKPSVVYASKREAVVEKIIKGISGRIMPSKISLSRPAAAGRSDDNTPFRYNAISADGSKVEIKLHVAAADFLIHSLERLAEDDQDARTHES